jgi:hypothetical protein
VFEKSETIGKLAEALAKAQSQMKPAIKDSDNPYFKSKYADLASIWDAVRVPLTSNGLCVSQTTDTVQGSSGVTIITTLLHTSGEWISGSLSLAPVKIDPQGVGAAITYGRRFGLSAITGICSEDEDDDGNTASGHTTPKAVSGRPAPNATGRVPQPVSHSASMPSPMERPGKGPETEIKCGQCDDTITAGIDASGKPYSAARMADLSTKSYRKAMCYNCFIETRRNGNGHGKEVAEALGAAAVKVEAYHQ